MLARLKRWWDGLETGDGFGQSMADDIRYLARFRRCRRQRVTWRVPTDDEVAAQDTHPLLGRFGDWPVLVAEVDGRRWSVRERIWHGWPDPARYAFFATQGEEVWAGADSMYGRTPGHRVPTERYNV